MVGSRGLGVRAWMLAGAAVTVIGAPAWANELRRFDIPGQDLAGALETFGRQSDQDVVFDAGLVRGKRAPAVLGAYRPDDALRRLLYGSGLGVRRINANSVMVETVGPQDVAPAAYAEPAIVAEVVVTGSRIRGAPPAAPVIAITAKDARVAGQRDLGELIRSVPQNFTGGQNPGIGSGAQAFGSQDLNAASNVNLRGLGPSASLTLLNGRRLAYGGANQGVDISAIPLAAIERVEIVADGGSALYGSDAIGGIANVILKRDYDGVRTDILVGGATEGGYLRRQASGTAGRAWGSGGVVLSGVVDRWSDVTAGQRDYARPLNASAILYPAVRTWGALGSAHQDLATGVTLGLDALYNQRKSTKAEPSTTTGAASFNGSVSRIDTRSFLLSPHLDFALPGRWQGSIAGTYGEDKAATDATFASAGVTSRTKLDYANRTRVVEANAEGPLVTLPGGDARLALGAGYRDVELTRTNQRVPQAGVVNTWSRGSAYGYGELFMPLISPRQAMRGVDRLTLSGAVRYEDHDGIGAVTTPKVGLIYAPTRDLQFSATWGRSFKTPTLFEQYQGYRAVLLSPAVLGSPPSTPGATALYLEGGNPALKAERSTNWTATLTYEPATLDGLRLQASYFDIAYRDRIIAPISSLGSALTNPVYAPFIVRAPTVAQLDAGIAGSTSGLQNASGGTYVAANVTAIVDARLENVARQWARGADLLVGYQVDLTSGRSLQTSLGATYLDLSNQLRPADPTIQLSGTLFNPPRWRGRGAVTWVSERATLGAFVNYVGPLDDVRPGSLRKHVGPQTTLDLSASTRLSAIKLAQEVELRLTATNVFNARPKAIWTTSAISTPFESVNYSALGRQLTLSLGITW